VCDSIDPDLQVQMRARMREKREGWRDMEVSKSERLVGCGEVHEETNLRLSGASVC